jgi:hypothetical protein
MADMIATPEQLTLLMQDSGLDEELATLLLELATGEVQAMTGQRLVEVDGDEIELYVYRNTGMELTLPQRPVTAVTSVEIDGTAVTDYRWAAGSSRLIRDCWWSTRCPPPSIVGVTYSHGYASDDQGLVPAQSAVLGLARQVASNPSGVQSESIDDYRVQYASDLAAAAATAENLRWSLIRTYGTRSGGVAVLR